MAPISTRRLAALTAIAAAWPVVALAQRPDLGTSIDAITSALPPEHLGAAAAFFFVLGIIQWSRGSGLAWVALSGLLTAACAGALAISLLLGSYQKHDGRGKRARKTDAPACVTAVDCGWGEACAPVRGELGCYRTCTHDSECAVSLACIGAQGGSGICAPRP